MKFKSLILTISKKTKVEFINGITNKEIFIFLSTKHPGKLIEKTRSKITKFNHIHIKHLLDNKVKYTSLKIDNCSVKNKTIELCGSDDKDIRILGFEILKKELSKYK